MFPPEYIDGKWIIRYGITGSVSIRDRHVKQKDWLEYLMWRSDGIPSCHPSFVLVLYNDKVLNQLHKLGNVGLNTEDIDPNTDIQELQNLWNNNDDKKSCKENFTLLHLIFLEQNPIGFRNVINSKVFHFFILI